MRAGIATSWMTLAQGFESFTLAACLLPREVADDAAVVYALCRRADDAIDLAPVLERPAALARLRGELDLIWSDRVPADPRLAAFQDLARRRGLPRAYLEDLFDGFEMDVRRHCFATLEDLLGYCYRVAGTVGVMMCHLMGVRSPEALRRGAHLGIAMQLTKLCRDVAEDWENGRLYLPRSLLGRTPLPGRPFPPRLALRAKLAVEALLDEADRYNRSADEGLPLLGWRCALAVRTARLAFAAIGAELLARDSDVLGGRAVVSTFVKLLLVGRALLAALPGVHASRHPEPASEALVLRFPDDVLPI